MSESINSINRRTEYIENQEILYLW